jgi:hypothetical protein
MIFLKKHWKKLLGIALFSPIFLFLTATAIIYIQQEKLVQFYLEEFNQDIHGHIVIRKSRVAPFRNFPYISIDLKDVKIYESENEISGRPLIELSDVYVGFDLWKLLGGKTEIKAITLKDGHLDIIQDENANLNISRAFELKKPVEEVAEAFHLVLKKIKLVNVDINKHNLENLFTIDAFIKEGIIKVDINDDRQILHADCDFILSVVQDGDTTFFKNKHGDIHTDFSFDFDNYLMDFKPSIIAIEKAKFRFEGTIDLADDAYLDLKLGGEKPNFDLFLSFAPDELAPTLKRYENAGDVYFNAEITGKSLNTIPHIEARFGCKETFISNQFNKKKVDQLQFNAFFTTGDSNTLETMYFELKDFEARPEAGRFKADLTVVNFSSPDINLKLDSDFNLEFLAEFFEIDNLYQLSGKVLLTMNFHDIIDLAHPEKSLEKLDQSYYAKLRVNNLSFSSPDFHLPIKNITIAAETSGTDLKIDKIDAKIGKSDIFMSGKLTNIPDLLHHTDNDVELELSAKSKILDLKDLTQSKKNPDDFINDEIRNFRTHFKFIGSARDITEFKHLPRGRFILDDLYASFRSYPHKLHDFDIEINVEDDFIALKKFHGEIDKSDIDIEGKISNYGMFLHPETNGDTDIQFDIHSKHLILKDLMTYNGENFLPEDYRHEVIDNLRLVGKASIHFKNSEMHSTDLYLEKLQGKMKLHPLKFENFKGRIHIEDEHLVIQSLSGKMGHSQFTTYLNYYYGENPKIKKRDNYLKFTASRLDVDELTNYSDPKPGDPIDHDSVFNIYELPFPDMRFDVNVKELNYHKYKITNVAAKLHTTTEHYIHIDQMDMDLADGHLKGKGYFDGRDKNKIYLNPDFQFDRMDLTKLMLKFDNFGQDELVSDNLTGKISGKITGKIRMHTDMVPIIDQSLIKMEMTVLNGVIINYAPFKAMEDFFKDKNLNRVAFDTLYNTLTVDKGIMTIPSMTINTSIGFLILEGTQDMDLNMNYLVRVPFKMVTQAASQKLFKRKKEDVDPDKEDDIIYHDPNKKTTFINVRITGNPDVYKVSIERRKP